MNANVKLTSSSLLKFYQDRDELFNELHTRPFPVIDTPARLSQFAVLRDLENPQYQALEHQHLVSLCQRYSINPPALGASCYYQDFGGFELRWERHLEFANFTFICPDTKPFSDDALAFIPKDWLDSMPGEIMVAVKLVVTDIKPDNPTLHRWFEGQRLSGSLVNGEKAQVWTSFKLHSDGFGRMAVLNQGLSPYQAGRLIQRLYELETYRLTSLLALPIARQLLQDLNPIVDAHTALNKNISEIDKERDERQLLQALSHLAAEVERLRSDTNFRFSASVAYYDLVQDRLKQLRETTVDGVQSLREFLERRLTPGIKTCNSARDRLEDLSQRIHQTTSLLRTRVDLSIQQQNQRVLSSMNRRGQLQLRLQQTVEGLSVVVIGYYLLALLGIVFDGVKAQGVEINTTLAKAYALPVVLLLVFTSLHFAKSKIRTSGKRSGGTDFTD